MDATNTTDHDHAHECQTCEYGRIYCDDDSVIACECPEGQDVAAKWDACDGVW
jgi:hypothetical protein